MTTFGCFLSSEELGPRSLVRAAQQAEAAGFDRIWISDHYHPWNDAQGESPFVWSAIGAIAATTELHITTAVTCPTMRIHPAVVAQAAATSALLAEGRFTLGVGTGERLNEHILGDAWPATDVRLEMLEEAVEVMRALWTGEAVSHRGRHYTVEDARIYSCPDEAPPVFVSAFGPKATEVAARIGDGFCGTQPDAALVGRYRELGGKGPAQGGLKLCWGDDEEAAVETAHARWSTQGIPGEASQELRVPKHFEQVAELVTKEMTADAISCGLDPEVHVQKIKAFVDAGYDEVYVSQIGDDQESFFEAWQRELLPRLQA